MFRIASITERDLLEIGLTAAQVGETIMAAAGEAGIDEKYIPTRRAVLGQCLRRLFMGIKHSRQHLSCGPKLHIIPGYRNLA